MLYTSVILNTPWPYIIEIKNRGNPSTLKIVGIEHVPRLIKGGDRITKVITESLSVSIQKDNDFIIKSAIQINLN